MPKSQSASAHRFLIVSASACYTDYTGTKEQIISLGIAKANHFPQGAKRVSYGFEPGECQIHSENDFKIKRIRGGLFRLRKWHQQHQVQSSKARSVPFNKLTLSYEPEGATDRSSPYVQSRG